MAPLAVSVCEVPMQIDGAAGVTLIVGVVMTLTVIAALALWHPPTVCET